MPINVFTRETRFANDWEFPLRGFFWDQEDVPPHQQTFSEIVFILHGKAEHYTEPAKWHPIRRGDVWFIPSYGIHGYRKTRDLKIFNLLFIPDRLPMPLLDLYVNPGYKRLFSIDCRFKENIEPYPHLQLSEKRMRELESLLHHFVQFHEARTPGRNPGKYGVFMAIISRLCDLSLVGTTEETEEEIHPLDISRFVRFLGENYAAKLGIPELEKRFAMSESSLRRHFLHAFGMAPMRYIRHFRLTIAERLLSNTMLPVKEIAQKSGFGSASYFGKMFRAVYHMSPEEYRLKAEKRSQPPIPAFSGIPHPR